VAQYVPGPADPSQKEVSGSVLFIWVVGIEPVQVTFTTDTFNLLCQVDRFKFLHSLYNLFGLAVGEISSLRKSMVEIHCAKTEIENLHLRSLTGTGTHRPTKRNADDDDDDDGNENGSEMFRSITRATPTRNVFEQAIAVGRELAKAGYLLTPGPTPLASMYIISFLST